MERIKELLAERIKDFYWKTVVNIERKQIIKALKEKEAKRRI